MQSHSVLAMKGITRPPALSKRQTRHRHKLFLEVGECRTYSTATPASSFTRVRNSCWRVDSSHAWASDRPFVVSRGLDRFLAAR
jgi:hypothetical protein